MGCSLFACFRSSKHKKLTVKVQENGSSKPQQQQSVVLPLVQDHPQSETLVSPSLQKLQDKTEEEISVGLKKKVTFESNVKTYESVLAEKDTEEVVVRNTEGVVTRKMQNLMIWVDDLSDDDDDDDDDGIREEDGSVRPKRIRWIYNGERKKKV